MTPCIDPGCLDEDRAFAFLICYDKDSKAEINDWFDYTAPNDEIVRENERRTHGLETICCGKYEGKPIRGPFIMIRPELRGFKDRSKFNFIDTDLARLQINPNDTIARKRYEEKIAGKKCWEKIPEDNELWFGYQPFYSLNEIKTKYVMNRYVTPDLYKKVREETDLKQDWECELKEEWFGAKQDISHTKIARDMSSEFGCRTGDCESCLGTLKSFKNLTDKRKTRYRDAKRKMPKSFRAEKVEVGCCSGH